MSLLIQDTSRYASAASRVLPPRHVYLLSLLLTLVGGVTAALTFFFPDVLTGPPVTNGNARGTALVMLALATPLLVFSIWWEQRGSWRARFLWLGSLFYLGYNAFLLLFLTPFNSLFLLYVATLSLALFSIGALVLAGRDVPTERQVDRIPVRALAIFVWTIVALNVLAWLQVVVPAVFSDDPTSFLDGLGVATNAIYVQDLVVWLPVMAVAGWWMWNRRPLGVLLTGSWLAFGVVEGIGIAVDQWFGHQADPMSPQASIEVIPMMIGLAIVNLIGLYFYLGKQSPRARTSESRASRPTPSGIPEA
jgi:hypothetical protein